MTKVLLIEDNLDFRENTVESLELSSYQLVATENGLELHDAIQAHLIK